MAEKYESSSMVRDNLVIGSYQPKTMEVAIVNGGGALVRGTVLGQITTGGKYQKCAIGAIDGSAVARCILAADVDATLAEKKALAYVDGEFNENVLTFGTATDAEDVREPLRSVGIVISASVVTG